MNKEEFQFKNKVILIYGFGISGKACFKYLKRNNNTFIGIQWQIIRYEFGSQENTWEVNDK